MNVAVRTSEIVTAQVSRIDNGVWARLECACCDARLHAGLGQDIPHRDAKTFARLHEGCGWKSQEGQ